MLSIVLYTAINYKISIFNNTVSLIPDSLFYYFILIYVSFVKLMFKDNCMIGLTILFKMDMQNFSKIEQNIKVSMLPAPAGNMLTPLFC